MWQFYKLDVRGKLVAAVRHQLMTPPATAGKQATAGMLATARIPAATRTPSFSKGYQQEKAQLQQLKRQQQQDLCRKSIKRK
jgi:hypothetical protein